MRQHAPHLRPLLLTLLLVAACGERDPAAPGAVEPRELTLAERRVVADANAFAFALLREVRQRESAPNVFLSPLSASMALGMTMNGAAGETWEAMRNALGHGGLEEDAINGAYRGLLDVLPNLDPEVEVGIANSVWADQRFPVRDSFYDAVRTWFDAEARTLDFRDPGTLDVINGWVDRSTRGRIPTILEEIAANEVMYLINAVYFKGTWTTRFDPARTADAPFQRADGTTVTARMMRLDTIEAPYAHTGGYDAIELPYGGGAYAMVVVVPREADGLDALVDALDADAWAELLEGLAEQPVSVRLPRIRLEYDRYLNDPLRSLGMGIALEPRADFTRMSPNDPCISWVRQKTFLEVDEKGTEAAAVTAVAMAERAALLGVDASRPFLFAIRERTTGALLFIGTLGDPTVHGVDAPEPPTVTC